MPHYSEWCAVLHISMPIMHCIEIYPFAFQLDQVAQNILASSEALNDYDYTHPHTHNRMPATLSFH